MLLPYSGAEDSGSTCLPDYSMLQPRSWLPSRKRCWSSAAVPSKFILSPLLVNISMWVFSLLPCVNSFCSLHHHRYYLSQVFFIYKILFWMELGIVDSNGFPTSFCSLCPMWLHDITPIAVLATVLYYRSLRPGQNRRATLRRQEGFPEQDPSWRRGPVQDIKTVLLLTDPHCYICVICSWWKWCEVRGLRFL